MASVIMKSVCQNLTAIPSLCIDIVQDVRFTRRSVNDIHQALALDFSNPITADEVISRGP